MLYIQKQDKKYPFSKGILARSIAPTGLSIETIYEIVREINDELVDEFDEPVNPKNISQKVIEKLRDRGFESEEKYYRVSRKVAQIKKPLISLVGGATGVGKSAISAALARKLGMERVINSDTNREIMRYMIPRDLMPSLHESSFNAGRTLKNPNIKDKLIYGFNEQVSLVNRGVHAYIKRSIKEGLKSIINGVHLLPGYLDLEEYGDKLLFFHYFLHLNNEEEHLQRFHYRTEGSFRHAERYTQKIEEIRSIQRYMREVAEKQDATTIVENQDFDSTVNTILQDLIKKLEKEVLHE